jgi:capsular exopolysaccharide synthesis family protein
MPKSQRTKTLLQYHESIRGLRMNIEFVRLDVPLHSLLVTSASAAEGKSTIAANLAFSYALTGRKVLLVDADMRRPALHVMFEKKSSNGLAEVLEEKMRWNDGLLKIAREHLYLLPAGTMSERSSDLVQTGVYKLLEEAYQEFDLVILDGPPLLGAPESAQLAAMATAVLMVSRAGFSTKKRVNEAYSLLKRARARIVGMVIDDVPEGDVAHYSPRKPVALRESA